MADPRPAPEKPRPRLFLVGLGVAAVAVLLAAYSNFFENGFHFDDNHVLVENLYVRSLRNLPRFFSDASTFSKLPANATYRPLVTSSLAFDYAAGGGLRPRVFHASQLAQMALLGVALFFFYQRVMDASQPSPGNALAALFAAAFFCVHTLNTETLNLMHARSEIQSALGVVGAFLVYLAGGRARRLGLYNLPMLVGALAKPPAVLFGPLLFVYVALSSRWTDTEVRASKRPWRGALRGALRAAWLPTALGAVAFVAITRLDAPGRDYGGGNRYHYALTQIWAWLHYLRLFVLPLGLTADTDLRLIQDWFDTRVFAGALVLCALAVVGGGCALFERTWPIAFGLLWFALGLAPASSVVPLAEPLNDHRPFLGLVGLILASVWGARVAWQDWTARRPKLPAGARLVPQVAGLAILVLHAVGTHRRNETWRDAETLWRDVTVKSPENGRGWMNYGLALMARADYAGARASFTRAQVYTPNYYVLEINLGILAGALGDAPEAEAHLQRAEKLEPNLPDPHYYFGRYLAEKGRGPEAIEKLARAVHLTPGFDAASSLLMDLQAAKGDSAAAASVARAVLAIDPGNARAATYASGRLPVDPGGSAPAALFAAGLGLGGRGQHLGAALAYRAALAQDPKYADALNNLGWSLGKLGFFPEAVAPLQEALRLKPDFQLARNNLAWVESLRK